jgi:hypothetical protein
MSIKGSVRGCVDAACRHNLQLGITSPEWAETLVLVMTTRLIG